MSFYDLETKSLEGKPMPLSGFRGKVSLIVNVASACGFTPQYAGLERIHQRYADRGFSVLGFPSNDFGAQEPGSPEQIREFCSTRYDVKFPLFEKVVTKSKPEQSPIYAHLGRESGTLPSWNFGKYLVDRKGRVVAFFGSRVDPEDPKLVAKVEELLAAAP